MEFERDFPDDAACLEWLLHHRYPNGVYCPTCQRVTKHHRERKRTSYSCQFCGHRVHPMVGTIFENSATSLKLWMYAIYLMTSTRCGISAKQLERELGVTYKTAWRMAKQIRSMLDQDGDDVFTGTVEMDEAYIGGRHQWRHDSQKKAAGLTTGRPSKNDPFKTAVFGVVQRGASGRKGQVMAKVVDGPSLKMLELARAKVKPGSTVYTDQWDLYRTMADLYTHGSVDHSKKVYVSGEVHVQTIEGFWSLVKRGISGVYHGVSAKHLQSYLDEYVFRYNARDALIERGVFGAALARIVPVEQPEA
jgi:transposase-like protein